MAEQAAGDRLRRLLDHPDFQRLKASWRSLFEFVSQVEIDEKPEFSMLSLDACKLWKAVARRSAELSIRSVVRSFAIIRPIPEPREIE